MGAAGKPPPKDPADSLFDALQAAKEKKSASSKGQAAEAPSPGVTVDPPQPFPIGKPILILAALVLIASGLIWGLTRPRTSTFVESVTTEPPPARPESTLREIQPATTPARPQPPAQMARPQTPANSSDLRRRQIEAEREQRLARERAEREERERERERAERERDQEVQQAEDSARTRDWRSQQAEGYVPDDSRPPEERPGSEGVVSRIAREQGVQLDDGRPEESPREEEPLIER